jgi:peptidoglycan/LPS O-acetylase OafA/YrhL
MSGKQRHAAHNPAPEPSAAFHGRIPQLDGLRALAILIVFVNHSLRVPLGWVGVDVFFVLSGFLITGILLERKQINEREGTGYLVPFYRRRFIRILPPYFLTLIVYHFVYRLDDLHPWPLFVFFGMNLQHFFYAGGPGDLPLWSLAVEEQFYLVWPFVVLFVSEKVLLRISLAALVIVPLLRIICTYWLHREFLIYTLTPFRADLLCVGAVLTILWKSRTPRLEEFLRRRACLGVLLGFGTLGILQIWPYFRLSSDQPLANGLCLSLSLFGAVSLLAWTLADKGWLHRLLTLAPMRYIGRISYTMYLVHVMVIVQFAQRIGWKHVTVPAITFTVFYATLSWFLMERPLLNLAARSTPTDLLKH